MKLLLKRDETGSAYPAADQVSIGELVINSVTGRLYTKLVDGSIVEFTSQRICFDPVPTINMFYENSLVVSDNIDKFCCAGAILTFDVLDLKTSPHEYGFELVELTNNSMPQDIQIQTPQYSDYTITIPANSNGGNSTPQIRSVRKAKVLINLSIANNQNNISIFKFTVLSITDGNKRLVEKIITIKCQEASI